MQKDTLNKLSCATIMLHWLIALLMISIIASGIYMTEWDDYDIYPLHKSFGILTFALASVRIIWRIYNGWPEIVDNLKIWEKLFARVTHYVLIISTIAIPLSGMIMTSMSGRPLVLFGWTLLKTNLDSAGERVPRSDFLAHLAHETHEIAGYVILGIILLHMIGAFKHHFIDKGRTLKRMLGCNA